MKYNDIKDVYAIVLFEKSSKAFHEYPDIFIHRFEQQSNSGMKLPLLQKFIFVPLDIYQQKQHNKINNEFIENRLDAWLSFFSNDDPEVVIAICEKYPDFKQMYHQIYNICRNLEDVMMMFSEELKQLDNNTTRLMMDEMYDQIALKDKALEQKSSALKQASTNMKQMAITMFEAGIPLEKIAQSANTDIKTIKSWLDEK